MYNVGDKLDLKDIDIFIEINSIYPGSQGMRLTIEGENYYGAMINGNKCYVGEKLIEWFHESISKKKAKEQEVKTIAEQAVKKLEKKRVKK